MGRTVYICSYWALCLGTSPILCMVDSYSFRMTQLTVSPCVKLSCSPLLSFPIMCPHVIHIITSVFLPLLQWSSRGLGHVLGVNRGCYWGEGCWGNSVMSRWLGHLSGKVSHCLSSCFSAWCVEFSSAMVCLSHFPSPGLVWSSLTGAGCCLCCPFCPEHCKGTSSCCVLWKGGRTSWLSRKRTRGQTLSPLVSGEKAPKRVSLVAQWLRICLLMQGTRVRALVWEDPTCRGATRPVSRNYWACASGACALQQERPR